LNELHDDAQSAAAPICAKRPVQAVDLVAGHRLRRRRDFGLKRPPNGRLTDAIDLGQLGHRLTLGVAIGSG